MATPSFDLNNEIVVLKMCIGLCSRSQQNSIAWSKDHEQYIQETTSVSQNSVEDSSLRKLQSMC